MDKFKLLRMKFEQKRKEKERQEEEEEAEEEYEDEDDVETDTVCAEAALPLASPTSPPSNYVQSDTNSNTTAVKKHASMPASKINSTPDNKPKLPDFLRRKNKPASMAPVKRDSNPLPTSNKPDFLKLKTKPASMAAMKHDVAPQPTNNKPDFLKRKSKPASMPALKGKEPPPVAKKPDFLKAKSKPASINVGKTDTKTKTEIKQDSKSKPNVISIPSKDNDKVMDEVQASKNATSAPLATRQDSQSKIKHVSKEHSKRVRIADTSEVTSDDKPASAHPPKEPVVPKSALKETRGNKEDQTLMVPPREPVQERKSSLTDEKLQELQETFMVFDLNRDGVITNEELGAVLFALGQRPTYDEINDLIRSVDLDRNGTIEFDEFVKIFSGKLILNPEQELYEVFCTFDENQDGLISPDELLDVLLKLGEHITKAEAVKMIEEADVNMDGFVDYTEFKHILNIR